MAERRAKGLCFFCDVPFSYEHSLKHRKIQVYVMEMDDNMDDQEHVEEAQQEADDPDVQEPVISVNAMTGVSNFRTMQITGYVGKRALHVLIDSGSTHNFLDEKMAQSLGCKLDPVESLSVTVADGSKVKVAARVKNFQWRIQDTMFTSDMMLLPLSCCDLVLGVEWLITLGNITWNFSKLTMEFFVKGRRHVLRGAASGVYTAKKKQLSKAISNGVHLAMLNLQVEHTDSMMNTLTTHADQPTVHAAIEQLLCQFDDVF